MLPQELIFQNGGSDLWLAQNLCVNDLFAEFFKFLPFLIFLIEF